MKDERITIRLTEEEKKEVILVADKYKMNITQFVKSAIKEKVETEKLSDSQEQFISIFDVAFKKSMDSFFKQQMVVMNRIEFNTYKDEIYTFFKNVLANFKPTKIWNYLSICFFVY